MIKDLLTLGDTVELMSSADYRDRFVGEYVQTALRYERLKSFNTAIEAAEEWMWCDDMIDHDCPLELLQSQQKAMGEYLHCLEVRAKIEDIDLADVIAHLIRKKQLCCTEGRAKCEEGIYGETESKLGDTESESLKLKPVGKENAVKAPPTLEGCPVKVGDNVISVLEDEDHVVELFSWRVCGVALFEGRYYALDESREMYEVGSSLCLPEKDIREAVERIRGKEI